MVREGGISATRPIFPSYLLPTSFKLPFTRRTSASSSSSGGSDDATTTTSAVSSSLTTPNNSPPKRDALIQPVSTSHTSPSRSLRLSRVAPDTLRCSTCSTDLALASQIISKGFTGRYGRAFLVAPEPQVPSSIGSGCSPTYHPGKSLLLNIRIGKNENRQLVTGWHVVADITCTTCSTKLGWKYVDAKEQSQKYKIGKYILETERVMTFRHWEDVEEMSREGDDEEGEEMEEVEFDSGDEEECEDIFAVTWDRDVVTQRRSRIVARQNMDA